MTKIQPSTCPACGDDALYAKCGLKSAEYRGATRQIADWAHECESCGAVLFDAEDVKRNRRSWNFFRKQVDHVPIGCEIAAMRHRAKLSQKQAGELFGGGPVAFSKYENDDLIPDEAMSNLLRLAIAYPDIPEKLRSLRQSYVHIAVMSYAAPKEGVDVHEWSDNGEAELALVPVHTIDRLQTADILPEQSWTPRLH